MKKPHPAALQFEGPDAPDASYPCQQTSIRVRRAPRIVHTPIPWEISDGSIPAWSHGLTLQGHSQASSVIQQLLQCRVTKPGVTGEHSQQLFRMAFSFFFFF